MKAGMMESGMKEEVANTILAGCDSWFRFSGVFLFWALLRGGFLNIFFLGASFWQIQGLYHLVQLHGLRLLASRHVLLGAVSTGLGSGEYPEKGRAGSVLNVMAFQSGLGSG